MDSYSKPTHCANRSRGQDVHRKDRNSYLTDNTRKQNTHTHLQNPKINEFLWPPTPLERLGNYNELKLE